jgi:hypothetical protein
MTCAGVADLLAEFVAGDLSADRSAAVRAHLDGCAACRDEEAGFRSVLGLLEADAAATPDPGPAYWAAFAGRVRTRRAREAPAAPAPWWSRFARPLAVAAGAAALVFLALRPPLAPTAGEGEGDDLVAVLEPAGPDALAGIDDLTPDDARALPALLLAGAPAAKVRATPIPAPTPAPADPKKKPAAAKKAWTDEDDAPSAGTDALDGIDDLSEDDLDELLRRLDAMKT